MQISDSLKTDLELPKALYFIEGAFGPFLHVFASGGGGLFVQVLSDIFEHISFQ